jgi:hypothetical protein
MNELAYYVKFYKMGMDYGAYKQKISNYNDFQIENKEKEVFNFEKMIKVII